jgi:hypothetical protein
MLIVDSLLSAPVRGLMFVLEKVNEAVRQEIEAGDHAAMAELSALHASLESGAISEDEFNAREQILLDRLDRTTAQPGGDGA